VQISFLFLFEAAVRWICSLDMLWSTGGHFAWFQASVAKMRPVLFWVIPQRVVVISYRRFGTTYRSNLQGSWRWYR